MMLGLGLVSSLEIPICLMSMFLDCGKKPEHLERTQHTHANTRDTTEPTTFLLQSNIANLLGAIISD